jgi:serine/threonine protein kinase
MAHESVFSNSTWQAHLSQILGFEETGLSILLRLERGMSLDKCVHPETMMSTVSTSDVTALWSQVAKALDYLHVRRIMHDDVKPDNIMWHTETSHAVLMDFGAASFHPKSEQPHFNPSGTPPYAPPEYLDRRKGPASDVWALGVTILFAMGYIRLPVGAWILPHALEGKDDSKPRKQMLEWLSDVKLWAEKLHSEQETLARMLNPNPDERITSSDLAHQLQGLAGGSNKADRAT